MPRTSAAHATEMRQRILDGAYRAMLGGGYRGTTMPAIAAEADVSVGLLYRYFDSKEELYLAMCEGVTQAQLDELAAHLGTIADPRERLARAVGPLRREPRGGALGRDRHDRLGRGGRAARAARHPAAPLRPGPRLRGDVPARGGRARRDRADVDVEELSLGTAMLLDGVIAHHAESGDRFDADLVPALGQRPPRSGDAPLDGRPRMIGAAMTRPSRPPVTVLAPGDVVARASAA